ncbi:hypothetical protein H6G97_36015 [Nostoc flagelliforme FACHB-838]|uniref:Uncharacterized protein n=1 Tax=Nostoc flagelliforme FACHB-838 TaxID=2692904 RepID=A0ABR8E0G2_9NOSO|nr:hypothetical protein [Nostoc flagelliforme]MBD2534597.1 hypothetical protein [Nostoc flagelliforme FACHB-838]
MQSIKLCSHVGADGILRLEISVGITDKEMEVVGIYQQIEPSAPSKTPQGLGWSSGFFEQTYTSCQDAPIVIDYEGDFETREEVADGIY